MLPWRLGSSSPGSCGWTGEMFVVPGELLIFSAILGLVAGLWWAYLNIDLNRRFLDRIRTIATSKDDPGERCRMIAYLITVELEEGQQE